MAETLTLALLITTLGFGVICVRAPLSVAHLIMEWMKLVSAGGAGNLRASRAIDLMDNDRGSYEKEFKDQLVTIRRTGWTALVVSALGLCMLLFANHYP